MDNKEIEKKLDLIISKLEKILPYLEEIEKEKRMIRYKINQKTGELIQL